MSFIYHALLSLTPDTTIIAFSKCRIYCWSNSLTNERRPYGDDNQHLTYDLAINIE